MSFPKMMCAYHEAQFITNFCAEKQCLLPLCPVCISGHTRHHMERSTFPKFQSIEESCMKASQGMDDQCKQLQILRQLITHIVSKKENSRKDIVKILTETKTNIIYKIQHLFEDMIQETIKAISAKQEETGLFSNQKMYEAFGKINNTVKNLGDLKSSIKGQKGEECLSDLIKYLSVEGLRHESQIEELERDVRLNQEFHACIDIKEDITNHIVNIIRGGIRMKFVLPTLQSRLDNKPSTAMVTQPSHILSRTPSLMLDQSKRTFMSMSKERYNDIPFKRPVQFPHPATFNPHPTTHLLRPSSSGSRNSAPILHPNFHFKPFVPPTTQKQNNSGITKIKSTASQNQSKIKKGLKMINQNGETVRQ